MFIGTILHLLIGTTSSALALVLYSGHKKNRHEGVTFLANVFMLFGLYAFLIAIPTIIFPNQLLLSALSYNIAISIIFILFLTGLQIPVFKTISIFNKNRTTFNIILTILGSIVVTLQWYDFKTPIIIHDIIVWNMNPLAAWITGLSSLFFGLTWGYSFFKSSLIVKRKWQKAKLLTLSANGSLLGISGFIFFTAPGNFLSTFGTFLIFISCLVTSLIVLADRATKRG